MRLFLGLEIPESTKNHIQSYLENIKSSDKGWENPADYHLTILFLGECEENERNSIIQRMESIQFDKFVLKTNGFHFFNRRILYLGFTDSPELFYLKKHVNLLFPEWAQKETKLYVPHVTVKRWQRYEFNDLSQQLDEHQFHDVEFFVSKLSLFKSERDQSQNKYHVILKNDFM